LKVLQINTSVNLGSTGRIAEDLGRVLISEGHESYIGYGRKAYCSESETVKIGYKIDQAIHVVQSRIFDRHGFSSTRATSDFINQIEKIDPDVIHLHNIHGYYLNISVLFNYLKEKKKPVIWTLHDCWPFTGHCTYFDAVNCFKWHARCYDCPNKKGYPASWFLDNSSINYIDKKRIFSDLENLTLVTPSQWLANHLRNSFLGNYNIRIINNGIDLDSFKPVYNDRLSKSLNITGRYILGVASIWDRRKGLDDFVKLRKLLPTDIKIVLVGLKTRQISELPDGILGISRTRDVAELVLFYSQASAFINPTYVDNFPTTNIESIACGTPVITYDAGGSPEAINEDTGFVVPKGDNEGLANAIYTVFEREKEVYSAHCRKRAEDLFDRDDRALDYLKLYQDALNNYS
jgi:putative colanic acid biosynthesis glycosyltransferase